MAIYVGWDAILFTTTQNLMRIELMLFQIDSSFSTQSVKVSGVTRSNLPSIITTNEFGHSNPSFVPDDDIDAAKTERKTSPVSLT